MQGQVTHASACHTQTGPPWKSCGPLTCLGAYTPSPLLNPKSHAIV